MVRRPLSASTAKRIRSSLDGTSFQDIRPDGSVTHVLGQSVTGAAGRYRPESPVLVAQLLRSHRLPLFPDDIGSFGLLLRRLFLDGFR
jgi:hypothetical protein